LIARAILRNEPIAKRKEKKALIEKEKKSCRRKKTEDKKSEDKKTKRAKKRPDEKPKPPQGSVGSATGETNVVRAECAGARGAL